MKRSEIVPYTHRELLVHVEVTQNIGGTCVSHLPTHPQTFAVHWLGFQED